MCGNKIMFMFLTSFNIFGIIKFQNVKFKSRLYFIHSGLMSYQTKVWKTKTGPLQGDKAWSANPNSALDPGLT